MGADAPNASTAATRGDAGGGAHGEVSSGAQAEPRLDKAYLASLEVRHVAELKVAQRSPQLLSSLSSTLDFEKCQIRNSVTAFDIFSFGM